MKNKSIFVVAILFMIVSGSIMFLTPGTVFGYGTFDGGCDTCHGGFRRSPYTSPKGGTWPGSLHDVHRDNMLTGTDRCMVCHTTPEDNPRTDHSQRTANNARPGFGCIGCHGRVYGSTPSGRGLREHHRKALVSTCSGCHPNPESTEPENVQPINYGGIYAVVNDTCNNPPGYAEDFSGDNEGLDNDGDNIYDTFDPDCSPITPTPTVTPVDTFTPTARPTATPASTKTSTPLPTATGAMRIPEGGSGYGLFLLTGFSILILALMRKSRIF